MVEHWVFVLGSFSLSLFVVGLVGQVGAWGPAVQKTHL